ncbi:tRNA pseudouridine(38-40) synthase [Flavobacteriaceae bacterium UJ101]|nr:tRNA pseudouridine(38-40) synthase [Flavobacteriaceae bacterium UJ101]
MRYFIELAYDGTHYHGWQIQPNAISIQETIEKCLSTLLATEIKITGAGRTDSGVHAKQMFAHFDSGTPLNENLIHRMNNFLPKDIVILDLFSVKKDAHTRFDATSRRYEYHISLRKNPFNHHSTWQFSKMDLDINLMNQAAQLLFDYTDFTSFSKLHTDVKTNNCKIFKAEWRYIEKDLLCFEITADRFLRNMVRAIVGTLTDVGKKKLSLNDFKTIIENKNRSKAGASAPAKGLFLVEIKYPTTIK